MQGKANSQENSFDLKKLDELLQDVCTVHPKMPSVLYSFCDKQTSEIIDSEFLLIKSKGNEVREEDFIKLLLGSIVKCTAWYIDTHPTGKNQTPKEVVDFELDNMVDLVKEAKDLFIQKPSKTTSEFGELLLFMLLENRGIVQLLNKMSLKTNSDMPIHGLDAVHISVSNDSLIFYYGYSKVWENHEDALKDAVKEMKAYVNDAKRQNTELRLVRAHLDREKFGDYSKKIINLVSPYADDKSFVYESHAALIGYHWPLIDNPECPNSTELDEFLIREYLKNIPEMDSIIKDNIEAWSDAKKYKFIVWTLPLSSLIEFRAKFIERLKAL